MAELLRQAWAVARKDLLLEFRTRTAIVSAVVFTALVLTVSNGKGESVLLMPDQPVPDGTKVVG